MAIADIERVAARERALHEAAGSITGHASEAGGEGARDMLTDVLSVFGSDVGLQWVISPLGSPRGSRPAGPARAAGRCRRSGGCRRLPDPQRWITAARAAAGTTPTGSQASPCNTPPRDPPGLGPGPPSPSTAGNSPVANPGRTARFATARAQRSCSVWAPITRLARLTAKCPWAGSAADHVHAES